MKTKNKASRHLRADPFSEAFSNISEREMDLIVLAFAQIVQVEKPRFNFPGWVVAKINRVAADAIAAKKTIDELSARAKAAEEHQERLAQRCRDKDKLLSVLMPEYLKSLG